MNKNYEKLDKEKVEIIGYNGKDTEIEIPSEIDGKTVIGIGERAFSSYKENPSMGFGICEIKEVIDPIDGSVNFEIIEPIYSIKPIIVEEAEELPVEMYMDIESGPPIVVECPNCEMLKSVTIPNGVTYIGDFAFSGCASLQSIIIPESVTSIGNYAFEGCSSLQSIIIPEGVTSIGNNAFKGCTLLHSVTLPSSVTRVNSDVFNGCPNIKEIVGYANSAAYKYARNNNIDFISIGKISPFGYKELNDGTLEITEYNGYNTDVEIPAEIDGKRVTSIGEYAFKGCSSLQSITIPDSIAQIGCGAFMFCKSLRKIIIPAGVTSIGEDAFMSCTSLQSVTIPDSITKIGYCAFKDCTSLQSITLSEAVMSIGMEAFKGCDSLRIGVSKDNPKYYSKDGSLYNKSGKKIFESKVITMNTTDSNLDPKILKGLIDNFEMAQMWESGMDCSQSRGALTILADYLRRRIVYCPCIPRLSKKDVEQLRNAKGGEVVSAKNPAHMEHLILTNPNNPNSNFLPVFSKLDLDAQTQGNPNIQILAQPFPNVIKTVRKFKNVDEVVIDPFTEPFIINKQMLNVIERLSDI